MDAISMGEAGLQGWRGRVADAVAAPVARRAGLDVDHVRAALGAAFLVLAVVYVVRAAGQLAARR
ncbi:hypothetical protein [Trujillonella humicola]|uniref:hypothetical protein n=1 Tax=Trujillonella humicola TaxID=3383699 RepID=UPI0039062630